MGGLLRRSKTVIRVVVMCLYWCNQPTKPTTFHMPHPNPTRESLVYVHSHSTFSQSFPACLSSPPPSLFRSGLFTNLTANAPPLPPSPLPLPSFQGVMQTKTIGPHSSPPASDLPSSLGFPVPLFWWASRVTRPPRGGGEGSVLPPAWDQLSP